MKTKPERPIRSGARIRFVWTSVRHSTYENYSYSKRVRECVY